MVGVHVINLLRVMIIARILTPEDFGLFGMAMVVILGLMQLSQFGLKEAYIAHHYDSEQARKQWLHAIWTLDCIVRAAGALLVALTAWPIAKYFGDDRLMPMLLVLAATAPMMAFRNPSLIAAEKNISFKQVAQFELIMALTAFVVSVGLAWLTRSVWALVWGQFAGMLVAVSSSYVISNYRPRFRLDAEPLRAAFGFGKYVMATGFMTYITLQFDNLMIGAELGAAALGFYAIAFRIATIPKLVIGDVTSRTLYPWYSNAYREQPARLGRLWSDSFGYLCWAACAAYLPLYLFAGYYLILLFGDQWGPAEPLLKVLVLVGAFRSLSAVLAPLMLATRQPRLDTWVKLIETLILVPAVLYGVFITQQAIAVAWASAAAYGIGFFLRTGYCLNLAGYSLSQLLLRLSRPILGIVLTLATGIYYQTMGWHPVLSTFLMLCMLSGLCWCLEPGLRKIVRERTS